MAVGGVFFRFRAGLRDVIAPSERSASCGGTASFVEDVAKHVLGDIGHADLHFRPADANRADEELHFVLLPGEDMLDGGPDL